MLAYYVRASRDGDRVGKNAAWFAYSFSMGVSHLTFAAVAVVAGGAPAGAQASCGKPSAGAQVVTLDCAMAGGFPALNYSLTDASRRAGSFQLRGTPFCLTVNGTIASDGMPAIQLQPCTYANDPWQTFASLDDGTGSWVSSVTGECMDAVSGSKAPLEAMELYSCDGGQPNQVRFLRESMPVRLPQHSSPSLSPSSLRQSYSYDANTGFFTNAWGYCVGFC